MDGEDPFSQYFMDVGMEDEVDKNIFLTWRSLFQRYGFSKSASENYAKLFQYHNIDFDMLDELNHSILASMGIDKVGDRIKILRINKDDVEKEMESEDSEEKLGPKREKFSNSVPVNMDNRDNLGEKDKSFSISNDEYVQKIDDSFDNSNSDSKYIKYYVNENFKNLHKFKITNNERDVHQFTKYVKNTHKITEGFAVFCIDKEDKTLKVVKEDQLLDPNIIYYVIYYSKHDPVSKRIYRKIKRDFKVTTPKTVTGKPIYTSQNFPIVVDYIPESEVYLPEMGRIGLCMAPGRTKKKRIMIGKEVWI